MDEIKVSVLVTFYNQQSNVDISLESILSQKVNFRYQVLVGDDGSSDNTIVIIQKWIKKYPEIIELYVMDRENGITIPGFRASQNRLNLLTHVKGKYFIFLDGDDYFTDVNKLQQQVDILDNPEHASCVACAHNIDMLYPDGHSEAMISPKLQEGKVGAKKYWRKYYFHTNTLLVRSNVIHNLPVKLLENNFNDNLITFSVIQYGGIYYIPKSMAVYVQTGDGVWTGSRKAVNHIRNMFLYDLAIQINPKMKRETDIRCTSAWENMFHIRNELDKEAFRPLLDEAEDKDMRYSKMWICYKELRFTQKYILWFKSLRAITWIYSRRILAKLYHFLKSI